MNLSRVIVHSVTLAFAIAVPLLPASGQAEIVHESSVRSGSEGGGFILGGGSGYVQGSRFHLDSTTEIQFGGGRVQDNFGLPDTIRVSIVALEMSGLPANTPATMTALVSATAPSPRGDIDLIVPLPITLPPGDYGIVLSAVNSNSDSTAMPLENTNNPGASYFSGTDSGWADGNGAIPGFYARFFLYNRCGNAIVSADETCDDGNTTSDDGCDPFCRDLCGDSVIGLSEDCDDGNTDGDDCCNGVCNLPSVAACAAAGGGSLSVTYGDTDDKDKVAWKWAKGGAVEIEHFGDPATTTSFLVCVDQGRDSEESWNTASILMTPDPAWTGGEKLWKLKDKAGSTNLGGIATGTLKPGRAGKSSITLKGGGTLLPPLPLHPLYDVTVTMRTVGGGACWTSGSMPVIKSTNTKSIAKLP